MRLCDVLAAIEARPFTPDFDPDCWINAGFASDLMSDVLRYDLTGGLLITGLANEQVVRTAEMADAAAILLARGKTPQPETIRLAQETGIPLIGTNLIVFEACGKLYAAGLGACALQNGA